MKRKLSVELSSRNLRQGLAVIEPRAHALIVIPESIAWRASWDTVLLFGHVCVSGEATKDSRLHPAPGVGHLDCSVPRTSNCVLSPPQSQ